MKQCRPLLAPFFFALYGCAYNAAAPNSIGVESVVNSAASLEGKQVTVSGYLRFGDDTRNLWSSKGAYLAIRNGGPHALGLATDHCIALYDITSWRDALLSNDGKSVLIGGVVHRIPLKEGEISLSECSDLGISIRSIRRR
jgi:hypothetical protein